MRKERRVRWFGSIVVVWLEGSSILSRGELNAGKGPAVAACKQLGKLG